MVKHLAKLELSWICESNWKNTPCIWAMEKGQISNNLSHGYVVSMCNFLSYHLVKNETFLSHFSAVQCARVLVKIWQHLEVMVETGKPRLIYLLYRYVYNVDFIYIKIIAIKDFWPSPSPISWFFFFNGHSLRTSADIVTFLLLLCLILLEQNLWFQT